MAHGLMAKAFTTAMTQEMDWVVESAGVAASVGSRESRETATVLAEKNASLQGFLSRQVNEEMLAEAHAVFCMTSGHRDVLLDEFPEFADKCYLLCDFSTKNPGGDVPDPIGMGPKAYQRVAETIEDAIPGMLRFLLANTNTDQA